MMNKGLTEKENLPVTLRRQTISFKCQQLNGGIRIYKFFLNQFFFFFLLFFFFYGKTENFINSLE